MQRIVETCVIVDNLKVFYNYIKSERSGKLNPIGNFYRWSHLHKETQRFMENYLQSGILPKIGDEIFSEKLCSSLTVTKIFLDYKRNEGETFINNLEKKFLETRELIQNKEFPKATAGPSRYR